MNERLRRGLRRVIDRLNQRPGNERVRTIDGRLPSMTANVAFLVDERPAVILHDAYSLDLRMVRLLDDGVVAVNDTGLTAILTLQGVN